MEVSRGWFFFAALRTCLCLLLIYITVKLFWCYQRFSKFHLPSAPLCPGLGHLARVFFQIHSGYEHARFYYEKFKHHGLGGIFEFHKPVVVVADVEMLKLVTVKDFDHFTDHRDYDTGFFSKNLFGLKGNRWRQMRNMLSPAFTISKMKFIFEYLDQCGQQMEKFLDKRYTIQSSCFDNQDIILKLEFKELFTRFTNDAIASTVFGIEVDSFNNPQNEFFEMGRELVDFASPFNSFKTLLFVLNTRFAEWIWPEGLMNERPFKFFKQIIQNNLEKRREEGIVRPDMIHLLLEASQHKESTDNHLFSDEIELSDEDIQVQAILFFFAGFDTVSTTLSIAVSQIAEHPDVQKKIHEEIENTLKMCDGQPTYEAIRDMNYLDMVLSESMRRIPPVAFIDRSCVKPYTFPATSTRPAYTIQKNETVWLPVFGFHRDERYFPEPDKFIPERFSEGKNTNLMNPWAYFPFGVGPRICIANQFARIESKIAIFYLLKNFELTFIEETTYPMEFGPGLFGVPNPGGHWLGLKRRLN